MRLPASLARFSSSIPTPVRGALWMLFASACFAVVALAVRALSGILHPFEIAFFRSLFLLIFMLPALRFTGIAVFRTRRWPTYVVRSLSSVAAMATWFTALQLLPIAEATALNFTAPLFAIVGSAVILRESIGLRQWIAVAIGFLGALAIIRPGVEVISTGAMIALLAAVFAACVKLSVKSLARTESPAGQVFVMAVLTTILSLVPALFVWAPPPPEAWPLLILAGLAATGVQMGTAKAMTLADLSAMTPFDFSRLVFAALGGFLVFGELPDAWTWVGGAVVFAAAFYGALSGRRAATRASGGPSPPVEPGAGKP